MLEIKHLTKIYRTKGGADVKALDDVSIRFGETGLVFLLGKSGSGKSTLLNLAGGLDLPTSGEIVVLGKSSKDFTPGDFDAYRNTLIGFVFQEYNVLNEFNVADNVALALELQGKTKERDKVPEILREVGLETMAKRKPNTLSGGQKQRVAIARALVKNPQIILADEPTGALDSTTGKQVFDTLKRLSKTRLVLVVSHDREFAERYGDRIVELSDGKIVSDVTKVKDEAEPITDRIRRIGADTLTVRAGEADEATIRQIRTFLAESEGEVLISRGEKEIAGFRRANRIDETGAREHFQKTDEAALGGTSLGSAAPRFIRSRLPARKAIRIGASGLKLKPVRLLFTIFLSLVSFVMFGLSSTMMLYSPREVFVRSFSQSDNTHLVYRKFYESRTTYTYEDGSTDTSPSRTQAKFTPAEAEAIGGADAVGVYAASLDAFGNLTPGESAYDAPAIYGFAVPSEGHAPSAVRAGRLPQAEDELCVSSYFFECTTRGVWTQIDAQGNRRLQKPIRTESDLIGERLLLGNRIVSIVGIFDSGAVPARYEPLKRQTERDDSSLREAFLSYLESGLHTIALATRELALSLAAETSGGYARYFSSCQSFYGFWDEADFDSGSFSVYASGVALYDPASTKRLPVCRFDGSDAPLRDDELIVSAGEMQSFFAWQRAAWDSEKQSDPDYLAWQAEKLRQMEADPNRPARDAFLAEDGSPNEAAYEAALRVWERGWEQVLYPKDADFAALDAAFDVLCGIRFDPETGMQRIPTAAERDAAKQTVLAQAEVSYSVWLGRKNYAVSDAMQAMGEYRIVGFYFNPNPQIEIDSGFYCSEDFYREADVYAAAETETHYVEEADACYTALLVPLPRGEGALRAVFDGLEQTDPATDIVYSLSNALYLGIDLVNVIVDSLSIVFLAIGIVLMLFSALLLFHFITMSIANKKREIGILRAVGARGVDVFKIFFAESGIIVGICAALAIVCSFALAGLLNAYLRAETGLEVSVLVFGLPSTLILIGIAALVAVLGTFLPVFFASRKKPVEAIRAL